MFIQLIIVSKAEKWFDIKQESPHMLYACQVKDVELDINAIIHVDNSARVQTVTESSPRFQALLKLFFSKTGCPILLNTSFNVKGQPIVNSSRDAYECFTSTEIDVLVLGDYVVVKENS